MVSFFWAKIIIFLKFFKVDLCYVKSTIYTNPLLKLEIVSVSNVILNYLINNLIQMIDSPCVLKFQFTLCRYFYRVEF